MNNVIVMNSNNPKQKKTRSLAKNIEVVYFSPLKLHQIYYDNNISKIINKLVNFYSNHILFKIKKKCNEKKSNYYFLNIKNLQFQSEDIFFNFNY